jgi:hypothetical protein
MVVPIVLMQAAYRSIRPRVKQSILMPPQNVIGEA